ncbi:MAG TPA: alanine--tRNA ligase [Acidobacteriota bacterium]|nr:alanine--tRNA ligase [Acidobacteriota bacterium]
MKTNEVRKTFLDFFKDRGHTIVPSSSLIPHGDPTLLFTNAGMNQFKNVFLGTEKRDYLRAASCQKCLRAGGKHNDLENVGKTARHHTFFEMLGNFSFGDYFKKEATAWAWELVTQGFRMDGERLWISIHHSDDEAFQLWNKHVGVRAERIVRLGDKDNFWAMGDTGPCGPCSEMYYDQGPQFGCGRPECNLECDCGRYTEFWNLVFMQFNRNEKGELIPLPKPSIDTGAGLERTTALIQGVESNFEIDLIFPLIQLGSEMSGVKWKSSEETDVALKVLADHSRAATVLIAEGITPSNEGRGYVLRRIIRRALRYGRVLKFRDAFLFKMTSKVADLMQDVYPELTPARDYVSSVCKSEEEKFKSVVENATSELEEIFEQAKEQKRSELTGREVFKLYDTFGLPLDFVQEMATERNFTIDTTGFETEMEKQRQAARAAWKGDTTFEAQEVYRNLAVTYKTSFTGYSSLQETNCEIVQMLQDYNTVGKISKGEAAEIILNKTCFYAESGGQLGDRGHLVSSSGKAKVVDTQVPVQGLIVHKVEVLDGSFETGDFVDAIVDPAFRSSVRKNHTATHVLHATLREKLGEHVKQAGSLVAPDRLRFDFTHYGGLKADEIHDLEHRVNERVLSNYIVHTKTTTVEDAMAEGAMALFGEKYGDQVRMVTIGDFSKELCGGTHVATTGEVGAFLIGRESSTAAGIRRIEAITGETALNYVQQERKLIQDLTSSLKISREDLLHRIQELIERNKKLEKEIEKLKTKGLQSASDSALFRDEKLGDGKRIYVRVFEDSDSDQLGNFVDETFLSGAFQAVVACSHSTGAIAVRVGEGGDAAKLLRSYYAAEFGGGGGGRKDFAKGGLKRTKDQPPADFLQALVKLTARYFSEQ